MGWSIRGRWRRMSGLVVLALALRFMPTGMYAIEPGLVLPTRDAVTVRDGERPRAGRFLFVTVAARPAPLGLALWKALDPNASLVPKTAIVPPGKGVEAFLADAREQMKESQAFAVHAALRLRGLPAEVGGRGMRVLAVRPGTPASGKLVPGDVVVAAGGRPVSTGEDVLDALDRLPAGGRLMLAVERGGGRRQVTLSPGEGVRHLGLPGLGIEGVTEGLTARFPVKVGFAVREVAGPSAGLMFALEVLDQVDKSRDLTGGRAIAGTGAIWPSGRVGPVGGVRQKVAAARRAGAQVFLVPSSEADEARRAAGPMRVLPVSTLDDAVRALAPPGGVSQSAKKVGHLDGCHSRLEAFVTGLGPGPLHRLLDGIGRQHPEDHRHTRLEPHLADPLGHLAGHVSVVVGGAADDGSQADDGIEAARFGQPAGGQRDLKGSRYPGYGHVPLVGPVAAQPVHCSFEQAGGDEFVEAGDDEGELEAGCAEVPFEDVHSVRIILS